ncbi:hypothetical protein FHL15_004659 [Xylaria flabelliformis]|uniref:Pre-mRNA-splicing factor CWC22 n=1 Tax=Xylaria flabelliformis TaxID=2512241 RepID=A0A553I2T0_9PEZI|nr:hypothetical protein FHL15_004659 [Xylaria flabelliformis]
MAEVEATPHLRDSSPNALPIPRSPRSPRRDERPRNRDGGGDKYRPGRDHGRDRSGDRNGGPRQRTPPKLPTEEEKQAAAKAEYEKLLNMRSGGVYIPPARLRALQAQITDKTSKEYQRMAWDALKKSINGLINKVNTANIKHIVPELFQENLIRGRGLFCRSIMKAQAASLPFTPVLAAMAAIVNTKLPQVGELLVKRLVMQFRKSFRRNDRAVAGSSTTFLAHLANQQVVHEMVVAQILLLLLQKPTDDSVEIAVGLMKAVGQHLEEMSPAIARAVFDQFRSILHEADIDKRTQYMIEVLFQVRKDGYKDDPAIKEELDLIEEEDQITHRIELDANMDVEDGLNIFKFDPDWEENEAAYKRLRAEILGEGSDDEDDEDESSEEEEEDEEEKAMEIKDQSNTDLVNLRKTIYLTIMSSMDPEESVHKLLKINLPAGQEQELPSMVVECCAQEKTYTKFFGLIGERFAKLNRLWTDLFEQAFQNKYETIHRHDTNQLRNIARFFGHLFGSDAIGWHALSVIHLNEDETTSASRIFIKILFQEISEELGMPKLQARMRDETMQPSFEGLFPHDNARNIRFSINYFTSIGMGALTEEMREYLANMPKPALPAPVAKEADSESVSRPHHEESWTEAVHILEHRRETGGQGRTAEACPVLGLAPSARHEALHGVDRTHIHEAHPGGPNHSDRVKAFLALVRGLGHIARQEVRHHEPDEILAPQDTDRVVHFLGAPPDLDPRVEGEITHNPCHVRAHVHSRRRVVVAVLLFATTVARYLSALGPDGIRHIPLARPERGQSTTIALRDIV